MKFIADVMLGKLAKWLRIAGIDVLYNNKNNDDQLVIISNNQKRILLTRDRKLAVDKRLKEVILIENELIDKQLKEFFEKTHYKELDFFTRCILCNEMLEVVIKKHEIKEKVPIYTYLTHDEFSICNKCGRIFWKGTHRNNMKRKFEELLIE
ncbi:MAG: hypothetical protein A2Y62_15820 [Candidatus Fischerbacteria bacterium RBG_13_37_8]|uniref:Mut7-C RNAse domain-containing protein n=1 Tax=Candidatus Fischerbacteria bacterium RBG_13_37_8 TaxID=1817863 RepID=A0A1F5VVJ7_9BACT|nr:MAG: hypothetical protein A2Y62_15820 [Candidatus Fischerbacteria bacterium RBG_13_37_8]